MDILLEFENVSFNYEGHQPALKNFSIKIPSGKKCALLGQNGSGKSTVFLLANGLLKPREGTIRWKGKPVAFKKKSLKEHRKNTGLFFQNAEEMLISTVVKDDLSYGLLNAGYSGEDLIKKVDEIVKQYKLEGLMDRPIHHLSLGEKRRVALAGIMGLAPELLMLDEPTTYLDPGQMNAFLKELNKIHALGTTVMMSTHDLELAYEWADWMYVIEDGRLVFEGTPDDLFINKQFVLDKGLTIPLLFQLKQLVKMDSFHSPNTDQMKSKAEILFYLKTLLQKREEKADVR